MPIALNLLKAFERGIIRKLVILGGTIAHPETGKKWLILSGIVNHVTATDSDFYIYDQAKDIYVTSEALFHTQVDAAVTDTPCPLFNTAASAVQAQFQLFPIQDFNILSFEGGAGSSVTLLVLEWE